MLKRFITVGVILLATAAFAQDEVTLTLGDSDDGRADLVFKSEMTEADAFLIRTERVGAPGSVVSLSVDNAPTKLLEHTLTEEDCKFGDAGATCEIEVAGGTSAYRDLVAAFKAGLTVHLEVVNEGHMAMRSDASLKGFTKAFTGL